MHLIENNSAEGLALLGIYSRVSARVRQLEADKTRSHAGQLDFLWLCEVADALEVVGGLLNHETKQAREKLAAVRSCVAALTAEEQP